MAENFPITAARFSLTVDGETIASFSELNGIKTEIKSTEFIESGEKGLIQMNIPANPVMAEISFKRGQTKDNKMWVWHEAARRGEMGAARKSATLYMFDAAGEVVAKYTLEHAWPAKIELAALRAGSADVLTETIVLKCDHCQRIQ
jgi:phage tail-like protein